MKQDVVLIPINKDWSLTHDELQWILQRFKGVRKSGAQAGQEKWEGVSFVRSTKEILTRCMRDKGVPKEAADKALAQLPDTFKEFIQNAVISPSIEGHSAVRHRGEHRAGELVQ